MDRYAYNVLLQSEFFIMYTVVRLQDGILDDISCHDILLAKQILWTILRTFKTQPND